MKTSKMKKFLKNRRKSSGNAETADSDMKEQKLRNYALYVLIRNPSLWSNLKIINKKRELTPVLFMKNKIYAIIERPAPVGF